MISARTKAALASAKARGTPLGFANPKLAAVQAEASRAGAARVTSTADQFAANVVPLIEDIRANGITSLKGIARTLSARGIATRRGGEWTATSVRNVMNRNISDKSGF
jgi:DNA invertase Pin-like site-specific DNA recombinase